MKRAYMFMALALFVFTLKLNASSISVNGNISTNTTWSADTVKVTEEVIVDDDVILTINPGTVVLFEGHFKLKVFGTIKAIGAENDSIKFTSSNTIEGWHGIRFENHSGGANGAMDDNEPSELNYCIFEYGKAYMHNGGSEIDKSGGAIYVNNFDKLNILNSNFRNDSAALNGGAIYYNLSAINISNTTFYNNKSIGFSGSAGGGAIYAYRASGCVITKCDFINNSTQRGGGALYLQSTAKTELRNSVFHANTSNMGGGALYWQPFLHDKDTLLIVNTKICESLSAVNDGGAIYLNTGKNQVIKIVSSTINNNVAYRTGGGLYNKDGKLFIQNSVFAANIGAIGGTRYDGFPNITSNSEVISLGYNLIDNIGWKNVPANKGDIFGTEDAVIEHGLDADGNLTNASLCINTGVPDTSGLTLGQFDALGNPRIYNGSLDRLDKGAVEYQGEPQVLNALYVSHNKINLGVIPVNEAKIDSVFLNNAGTETISVSTITAPSGFEIALNNLSFGNSISSFNINAKDEATIYLKYQHATSVQHNEILSLTNNSANNSNAEIEVSALATSYPVLQGEITSNVDVCSDTAYLAGNVIIADNGKLNICAGTYVKVAGYYDITVNGSMNALGTSADSVFIVPIDTTAGWKGIRFDNSTLGANGQMNDNDSSVFSYCTFSYGKINSVNNFNGGAIGILHFDKVRLTGCVFANNDGWIGGALYLDNSNLKVDNCSFTNNSSVGNGGAIYVNSSAELYLYKSIFFGNSTINNGGALYAFGKGKIVNNIFGNNVGGDHGGAMYFPNSNYDVNNNLVCNNEAEKSGGGVYKNVCTGFFNNNTIVNNKSETYAALAGTSTCSNIKVNNCIIWGNESTQGGASVRSNLDLANSCIDEDYTENLTLNADPNFVSPSSGAGVGYNGLEANWGLQGTSLCINLGVEDTTGMGIPATDLLGQTRIFNGEQDRIDAGAIEYQGNPVAIKNIDVSSNTIDFVVVNISEGAIDSLVLSNTGNAKLLISSITTPSHFNVKTSEMPSYSPSISNITIPAFTSITLYIRFHPNTSGDYSGTIVINSNASNSAEENVAVKGIGTDSEIVSGIIASNRNICGEIVYVNGDITIPESVAVTICENTKLIFTDYYKIEVNGVLLANGTKLQPIVFTSLDTSGFHTQSNTGWNAIHFTGENNTGIVSTFNHCIFEYGVQDWYDDGFGAGAITASNYDTIAIHNSIFRNNRTVFDGAAIYAYKTNVGIVNSQVINNYAHERTAIRAMSGNLTVIGSLITNNECDWYGSAIDFSGDTLRIYNSTICNNLSENSTSAVYIGGSLKYGEIKNSIIWGNKSGNSVKPAKSAMTINNSLIEGGYTGPGANIIDVNPLFVNPSVNIGNHNDAFIADWSLQGSSDCINNGDVDGLGLLAVDLYGNNRINEGIVDIGAVEYTGTTGIEQINDSFEINVYPNPASEWIDISVVSVKSGGKIDIYYQNGTLIESVPLKEYKLSLDISAFLPGLYIISFNNGYEVVNRRFTVNR